MKIEKFTAESIRAALDKVRERQGPEAVILSNRKTALGVEIIAAAEYDEVLLQQVQGKKNYSESETTEIYVDNTQGSTTTSIATSNQGQLNKTQEDSAVATVEKSVESEYHSLRKEFGSLRALVQSQISHLSWSNLSQEQPEQAALVRSLTGMGLAGDIVASLAKDLAAINDPENAWREAIALFARRIPLSSEDLVSNGGIYAFVGTTGVGKTTTVAKLATRFVLQFGADQLGLVSYDSHAMAAADQLSRTGSILGVPVQQASGSADLRDTLSQLDSKKLVLIDTPGRSPRDPNFDAPLTGLVESTNRIGTILTLSGNAHEGFQRETINRYKHMELEAVAITKLDETTNLASLLSTLIREQLRIGYIAEGQALEKGIRSAHDYRAGIASRAVSLAKRFSEPPSNRTNMAAPTPPNMLARV